MFLLFTSGIAMIIGFIILGYRQIFNIYWLFGANLMIFFHVLQDIVEKSAGG